MTSNVSKNTFFSYVLLVCVLRCPLHKNKIFFSPLVLQQHQHNLEPINLPDGILDFVISCSSSQPSFSPIFIAEILRARGVTVSTPTQVHSSLRPIFDETVLKLTGGLHGRLQCPKSKVYFTYVWKEGNVLFHN